MTDPWGIAIHFRDRQTANIVAAEDWARKTLGLKTWHHCGPECRDDGGPVLMGRRGEPVTEGEAT